MKGLMIRILLLSSVSPNAEAS